MITKMKKVVLFLPNSTNDIDKDLTILGELGIMHIVPFQLPKDESIEKVDARIKQFEKAISILNKYKDTPLLNSESKDELSFINKHRGEIALLEKVLDTEKEYRKLEKLKEKLDKDLQWYHDWGNVSITDIAELNQNNVFIKFYLADKKVLKAISDNQNISIVGKLNDLYQIIFISEDINDGLKLLEIDIPEHGQAELNSSIKETDKQLKKYLSLLRILNSQKAILMEGLNERIKRLDIRNVRYGGRKINDQVIYCKGFIPEQSVEELVSIAEQNSWGYTINEPNQEEIDEVPTHFQSSKWAQKIRPVMNFMGLVPGYKELDVSNVFMIFFTFFTGVLVGDAGYGLVFLIITLLVHSKKKFTPIIEFKLIYTLSVSIMVWGIITGTYFGSQAIAEISFLSQLRIDKMASFGGDNIFIQRIMFGIGAIHLTIGHLQTAWKYNNSVKAIAQLGWVAIIWGLFLVVNQMVLGITAPAIMPWLFIGGINLVVLFSNPGTSFLKGIISSIGNLPLSIINGFSDIISYIRLYAVGLSTVLMATSFNHMAIGDGITTIVSGVGATLILVLGHGLNMVLAGMAVIVHGVRLNMLEYAGHASVEFSGSEYNPFKLKK